MEKVRKDETVEAFLRLRPQAVRVFLRHRMACPGCDLAPFETLEEVARIYRLPLETFLRELAEEGNHGHRELPAG
ncbi:MAG: DUF1858 domain-containing protein [Armatimonadota bacterium]|nr:DUF1858 domain-containing protein [Armatimonadota bacterium]MDR7440306.1 DUF1858 domain-containing protein [Armatimonadota bacterium]MDR7568356.1 DUF1858 domain-containing protein [Armatimonadota bacterium]MDR7602592.1 DUF1858 domain-containing protein [Armatimonadota bacterium]